MYANSGGKKISSNIQSEVFFSSYFFVIWIIFGSFFPTCYQILTILRLTGVKLYIYFRYTNILIVDQETDHEEFFFIICRMEYPSLSLYGQYSRLHGHFYINSSYIAYYQTLPSQTNESCQNYTYNQLIISHRKPFSYGNVWLV